MFPVAVVLATTDFSQNKGTNSIKVLHFAITLFYILSWHHAVVSNKCLLNIIYTGLNDSSL